MWVRRRPWYRVGRGFANDRAELGCDVRRLHASVCGAYVARIRAAVRRAIRPGRIVSRVARGRPAVGEFRVGVDWLGVGPGSCCAQQGFGAGVLANTTDGGATWTTLPAPGIDYGNARDPTSRVPFGVVGVRFVDAEHGFLFGAEMFSTADGGRTWVQRHPPGLVSDMAVATGGMYAIVHTCATPTSCEQPQNAAAVLYRVDGDGRRFTPAGPSATLDDRTQLITRGSKLFLFVPAPDLSPQPSHASVWSRDDGGSWQEHPALCGWSGADFGALAAWSATGLALVCGSEPGAGNQLKTGYVSTDAGRHWRKLPGVLDSSGYVADLAAANADSWVLAEARGTIEVTHDGGLSWTDASFVHPPASSVEGWGAVTFFSPTMAVAAPWTLNGSAVAITQDAGLTWSVVNFPSGR